MRRKRKRPSCITRSEVREIKCFANFHASALYSAWRQSTVSYVTGYAAPAKTDMYLYMYMCMCMYAHVQVHVSMARAHKSGSIGIPLAARTGRDVRFFSARIAHRDPAEYRFLRESRNERALNRRYQDPAGSRW